MKTCNSSAPKPLASGLLRHCRAAALACLFAACQGVFALPLVQARADEKSSATIVEKDNASARGEQNGSDSNASFDSVKAGKEALSPGWNSFPWYDAEQDALRKVGVREPAEPVESSIERTSSVSRSPFNFFAWLAWIGGAIVLALIIWLMLKFYLKREDSALTEEVAKPERTHRARVEALPFPVARATSDLLGEAERQAAQGNYREAIIYLYSHELVELDKQQLIHLTKGKTNRRYLRELTDRVPLRGLLEQTMLVFEDVFFGNYELDRARFDAVWSRLDEFAMLTNQARSA